VTYEQSRTKMLAALEVLEALRSMPDTDGSRDAETWKAAWHMAWQNAVEATKLWLDASK
jgi:hypothetical protein